MGEGEFAVNQNTSGSQYQWGRSVATDAAGNFVVVWVDGTNAGQDVRGQRFDADGTPVGSEFAINTYTTFAQTRAAVAGTPSGEFVVAWQSANQDGQASGVFARRYDANGLPLAAEFLVNQTTVGDQASPALAQADDGSFIVAWTSNHFGTFDVFARQFDASGVPLAGEFRVNSYTTGSQYGAAVASTGGGDFVVAWSGEGAGDSLGVFGRRYDATGSPVSGQFEVNSYTTGAQYVPAVATGPGGEFVIVWGSGTGFTTVGQDGDFGGVFGRHFDATGAPDTGEFQVNTYTTGYQIRPDVDILPSGRFVVAWSSGRYLSSSGQDGSDSGMFGQLMDPAGTRVGEEFQVNAYTTSAQRMAAVAADETGGFVVAWNSYLQDGSSFGVFGRRYPGEPGDTTPPSVTVTSPNGGETVAAGGNLSVTWTASDDVALDSFDVFLSRDGGSTFEPTPLCTSTEPTHTCSGEVSGPATSTARVKVVARDTSNNEAEDVSDADFSIVSAFITVTAPDNTGITFKVGTTKPIRFIHNLGKNEPVRIELNRNFPAGSWEVLADPALTTAAANSTFQWLVTGPATDGATARVRVTSVDIPSVGDTNNASFTIDSRVQVTAPNAAVSWASGSKHFIRWSHNYPVPHSFRIEIDADGNGTCEGTIAASVAATDATGSFQWTVAGTGSTNRICVTSTTDPLGTDRSDAAFTITP